MKYKHVVYQVEWGSDVDGTGPERWRGMELGRFDTEEEACIVKLIRRLQNEHQKSLCDE